MANHDPRRQRGEIVLFGYRSMATRDGREPVETRCPSCTRQTTMVSKRNRPWFMVLFIPIIPLGIGQPICECTACKTRFAVDVEVLRHKVEQTAAPTQRQAIALHHRVLEAPADAGRLLDLLHTYTTMNEPREVIAAARCFPQAMLGSAACHTVLGQAHLKLGDRAEALRCFDQALAIDPGNADAKMARQQVTTA